MVMEPVLLKNDIEISLHCLLKSSSVYKELCVMFPDINEERCDNSTNISIFDNHERFFVIPTCQKSNYDLIQIGVEIEKEKDRLLLTVSHCLWYNDTHMNTNGFLFLVVYTICSGHYYEVRGIGLMV